MQNFKVIYNIKNNDGYVYFDNKRYFKQFFDAVNFIRSLKQDNKNKIVGIPVIEEVKQ